MSTTHSNSSPPTAPLELATLDPAPSAAFLELRERSRALLRERSSRLHDLENRLTEQVNQLAKAVRVQVASASVRPADTERVAKLEAEVRHLQHLRQESEGALREAQMVLEEMESERRILVERLDSLDPRSSATGSMNVPAGTGVSASAAASAAAAEEVERLQRRLELALQEIRELKQHNAELSTRPAATAASVRAPVVEDSGSFDWETQKKRLLQRLETDFPHGEGDPKRERLQIEDVIRTTDRVVAEKDREITALRADLAQVASSAATVANDEQLAQGKVVDLDEAIRTEREKLRRIQEEWQEKLRKAEVEISIERAKLARERLQLEDRWRSQAAQSPVAGEEGKKGDEGKPAANPRGKWLTRLGLGGNE